MDQTDARQLWYLDYKYSGNIRMNGSYQPEDKGGGGEEGAAGKRRRRRRGAEYMLVTP